MQHAHQSTGNLCTIISLLIKREVVATRLSSSEMSPAQSSSASSAGRGRWNEMTPAGL